MPAESEKQRRAAAIAKHHPEQLYQRNRGLLEMTEKQLSEFAQKPKTGALRRGLERAKR